MGKLAFIVMFITVIALKSQADMHHHDNEPAYYKYTKEANEEAAQELHSHSHGSQHGHTHDHGHSHHGHTHDHGHLHHEHSHDAHEHHSHTHGSHHGHTHDDFEHSHEEHGHSHDGGCPYAHEQMGHDEESYYHGLDDEEYYEHGHESHYGESQHSHGQSDAGKKVKSAPKLWPKTPYDPNGPLAFMNNMRTRLWVYSIGSTLLISIAPFLILSVIPIQANTADNAPLLKILLAFGSGGLLGDAFLHLIPHAQPAGEGSSHSHSHAHSHGDGHAHAPHDMQVGGYVLGGIIAFLTVEKLVRIFRGEEGHSHGHSHIHSQSESISGKESHKEKAKGKEEDQKESKSHSSSSGEESSDGEKKQEEKAACNEVQEESPLKPHTGIKVAAYLNLAADFAHNVTDGLAIGASYLAGSTIGVVTMITVLVHEVPHEIGDFAILVQSGFSKKRAMLVQLVTALGALTGCAVSLWAAEAYGDLADATSTAPVLSFTAGGFIYIALVSVIPELLENTSFWQSVKESFAMMLGIYLMYLIGLYE